MVAYEKISIARLSVTSSSYPKYEMMLLNQFNFYSIERAALFSHSAFCLALKCGQAVSLGLTLVK